MIFKETGVLKEIGPLDILYIKKDESAIFQLEVIKALFLKEEAREILNTRFLYVNKGKNILI
jgi:hypothetical protein